MNTFLLVAWMACQSLDTGTTVYALNHGYSEGNRLLPKHPAGVVGFKVSINLFALWAWEREGKPKTIPLVAIGTGCTAGALNLRTIRKAGN